MKLYLTFFLTFLIGCELPGSSSDSVATIDRFTFDLTIYCQNSTDCSDGSANGASVKAYILESSDSCATAPTASQFIAQEETIIRCIGAVCVGGLSIWDSATGSGNLSIMIKVDTDNDGAFSEVGEPYYCEDSIPFNDGGAEKVDESSTTGTNGWADAS